MNINAKTVLPAFIWSIPVLLGLAIAYAATGFIPNAGPSINEGPVQVEAVSTIAAQGPDSVIFERNVLRLALPQSMQPQPEEEYIPPLTDPLRWTVVGIFLRESGAVVIVKIESSTHIVYLGKKLHEWTLSEAQADVTTWTKGEETRELRLNAAPRFTTKGAHKPRNKSGSVKRSLVNSVQFSEKYELDKKAAREIINDPVKLLEQALYKPVKEGDKVVGFIIRNIQEDSLLQKIGIQNDDVLMRLNGEEVNDPVALLQAYSGLERANSVAVDVKRNGVVKSILLELK